MHLCGSELARESDLSDSSMLNGPTHSRASSLPEGNAARLGVIFLLRRTDSCQDYVTAMSLFKPEIDRKHEANPDS